MTLFFLSFVLMSVMSGCGDDTQSSQTKSPSFQTQDKAHLYKLFKTEYLWYDQVEDVDYTIYNDPQQMINALKYSPLDKWSFALTQQEHDDIENQLTQGFGCHLNASAQIFFIETNSPCHRASLQRGDYIIAIDGELLNYEKYNDAQSNLGTQSTLSVLRKNVLLDIDITPSLYNFSASKSQILTTSNGTKVAHLIFDAFTQRSAYEIEDAFDFFSSNSVDELIIDLRYNRGGMLFTASVLMDKIAGLRNQGATQMLLKHNANYSTYDTAYTFESDSNSLDLNRVIFLTGHNSASASEAVINGLKPFMDVKVIGEKTAGKPVGMRGVRFNDYIYYLINFAIVNANNEGYFYSGLETDCSVVDNYDYSRLDPQESMLQEALYYLKNNSCS